MQELIIDLIASFDGWASAEGWPGWWGLEGPEYLRWLDERPDGDATSTLLMGANTYRLMSGFAAGSVPDGMDAFAEDEQASIDGLSLAPKVVFSSSLEAPLAWANTTLVSGEAVEAVAALKADGDGVLRTIGSLSLGRSLVRAGLADRIRVGLFPVITGATGHERIFDGYPDVLLDLVSSQTFDGRIQVLDYRPTVLDRPPLG